MTGQREWIHNFFGGTEDIYGTAYTAVGTFERKDADKEVREALSLLGASAGNHILDWCGGWGRHAIPLARLGYEVTLLDFSQEYLDRAGARANEKNVYLHLVHADFRETPSDIQADYAVNLFTAGLGYLGEENDIIALRSLKAALKPGATILIDTMNLFWIMRNFIPRQWHESADGTKWYLEKRSFDFHKNTLHTVCTYRDRAVKTELSCEHRLQLYNPADLVRLLTVSGFQPSGLFGELDGSKFELTSRRLVMTAQARM